MKIGITIAPLLQAKSIFPELQELLEMFISSEIGIRHFEFHTHLDFLGLEAFKILKQNGASFSLHIPHMYSNPAINFCSADKRDIKQARKALEDAIETARELKAKNITLHPDVPKKCDKKQALELLRSHLEYGLKLIDKDMFLLIENMPGKEYTLHSPLEMKNFVDSFKNKQVGVTWDVGHAYIAISNKFLEFPRVLKSRIKEVHILDVKKIRNKLTDHYALGSGILNFNKIIKELKKIKFNNLIVIEIIPKNPDEIEISRKILEKAIREA